MITQIAWDGHISRRVLDTDGRGDAWRWEELASRVPLSTPRYRADPGGSVYHIQVDDHLIMVSEADLDGPLRALVMAVVAADGGEPGPAAAGAFH